MKKDNFQKFEEIKVRKQMIECTFSPKTNSPSSMKNPNLSAEKAF